MIVSIAATTARRVASDGINSLRLRRLPHPQHRSVGVPRLLDPAVEEFLVFFQAEGGIRHYKVTGVQTCALPISESLLMAEQFAVEQSLRQCCTIDRHEGILRSEERRVGKECRSRWWTDP